MMFMCIAYFKFENIDLSLLFYIKKMFLFAYMRFDPPNQS